MDLIDDVNSRPGDGLRTELTAGRRLHVVQLFRQLSPDTDVKVP